MISVGENSGLLRLALNFSIIFNKIPDEIQDAFTGVAKALRVVMRKALVIHPGDMSELPDLSGLKILISHDAGH